MFKNFCIYFFLIGVFFSAVLISRSGESYSNGLQETLTEGDRIVICINPDVELSTSCVRIDYTIPGGKIGNTYAGVNIELR
jgi:hypothetical protein